MKKPATIIRQLQKLSKNCLITGKENTRPFECDGLSVYRQKPLAVVLPQSVEQKQQTARKNAIIVVVNVCLYSQYKFYFLFQKNTFYIYLVGFLCDW
jgi:hypothetical protein